jgi:hypothetical protein
MKSQSAARLRSIGFGLHPAVSRTRSATPRCFPALTWICRASQLRIAALPAFVSASFTMLLCGRGRATLVSGAGVGSSNVVEVALTSRWRG